MAALLADRAALPVCLFAYASVVFAKMRPLMIIILATAKHGYDTLLQRLTASLTLESPVSQHAPCIIVHTRIPLLLASYSTLQLSHLKIRSSCAMQQHRKISSTHLRSSIHLAAGGPLTCTRSRQSHVVRQWKYIDDSSADIIPLLKKT
jgi:hypothetical protein